jgi:hypothetical protein
MPDKAVHVEGLHELVRAFKIANKEVAKDVRTAIEQSGEPIRQYGSQLIRSELSGMRRGTLSWWRLRIGIEKNTIGYVVPERHGVRYHGDPNVVQAKRKRPKLAAELAEREERAVVANTGRVYDEFKDALNEVARAWARA